MKNIKSTCIKVIFAIFATHFIIKKFLDMQCFFYIKTNCYFISRSYGQTRCLERVWWWTAWNYFVN